MTENKKNLLLLLLVVILGVTAILTVYPATDEAVKVSKTADPRMRGLETPEKLWLNGYLGIFFRFKYLGNINWLLIPLLIHFFATIRKRERWQWALAAVWLASTLFLGVKGYTNLRYQLTLFPFTVTATLILLYDFLEDRKAYVKIGVFAFVLFMMGYNIHHYKDAFTKYTDLRFTLKEDYFPSRMLAYIENNKEINQRNRIYEFDEPIVYYHTRKPGLHFQSNIGIFSFVELKKKQYGNHEAAYKLLREANVGYLLMKTVWKRHYSDTILNEFLNCQCRLVMNDTGWLLYKMGDRSLKEMLDHPSKDEAVTHLPLWNPEGNTMEEISPQMLRFFATGRIKFDVIKKKRYTTLTSRARKASKANPVKMNLGFEFKRNSLNHPIPKAGQYVHFIADTSVTRRLMNTDNYIFISQYNPKTQKWSAEKYYFTSPYKRTYRVSLKVAEGVSRVILGYVLHVASADDQLSIHHLDLYITDKPLITIDTPMDKPIDKPINKPTQARRE